MGNTLPDFIIIGAMKCGTTSLYYYLRNHPDIHMPIEKELDFFVEENNFRKGVEWYQSQFDSRCKLNGEASPNYTKAHLFSGVPERMYTQLPDVKLILLYRDPVDRAISHYIHNLAIGAEKGSPERAISKESKYVKTSLYYWQLQQYLKIYDKKQLLILNADDLRNNREKTLQNVYDFLGVDYFYAEEIIEKDRHQSSKKTQRNWFNSLILKTRIGAFLKKIAPEELKTSYKQATEKDLQVPEFSDELKEKIRAYTSSDFEEFQAFIKGMK